MTTEPVTKELKKKTQFFHLGEDPLELHWLLCENAPDLPSPVPHGSPQLEPSLKITSMALLAILEPVEGCWEQDF